MARAKSAVLSATDKKAVLTQAKGDAKHTAIAVKTATKTHAATVKAHAKAVTAHEKNLAKLTKAADKAAADLAALTV